MNRPVAAEYDYHKRKWVVLIQGPGGGGTIEYDGPPPEEVERQEQERKRKEARDKFWKPWKK